MCLSFADMKTRKQWKRIFDEQFSMFEAMYSGPSPEGLLYRVPDEGSYGYATRKTTIHLEKDVPPMPRPTDRVRIQTNFIWQCGIKSRFLYNAKKATFVVSTATLCFILDNYKDVAVHMKRLEGAPIVFYR